MQNSLFLFIFCFLLNQNLFAQKSTLSLGNCIEQAQQNSFLIHADAQKTIAAQKKYQFERAQSLPQMTGELAAGRYQLEPYSFDQTAAFVYGDWSLGDFFLNTAQSARQEKLIAETDNQQTRLDISLSSAMLYIRILQAYAQKELLQQRLNLLNSHFHVAKALWQAGTRTQFDVLQTETEIARLKETIALLELESQNLLQELAQLINEKRADNIYLRPFDSERICNMQLPDFLPEIMQSMPVIQSFDLRIKAQQLRTRAVTAQQLPHFNLSGGFMRDGDPTGDGDYWQMGVGISLPLFRWNVVSFQKQESRALTQMLYFQKQEMERNISIFINQTQQKLVKLKKIIQLQGQRLKTTDNAFKIAEANYQAGLMTNLEYLSVQQQLTETHIAIQETQLNYISTLVQFYIITNQLDKIKKLENME